MTGVSLALAANIHVSKSDLEKGACSASRAINDKLHDVTISTT